MHISITISIYYILQKQIKKISKYYIIFKNNVLTYLVM